MQYTKQQALTALLTLVLLIPALLIWLFGPYSGIRPYLLIFAYMAIFAGHLFGAFQMIRSCKLDLGTMVVLGIAGAVFLAVNTITFVVFMNVPVGIKSIVFWNFLEIVLEAIADVLIILLNGGLQHE